MKITFISPFSNLLKEFTSVSILGIAQKKEIVKYEFLDLFSFSNDANNRIDDSPYGGGYGMVLTPQPLFDAYKSVKYNKNEGARVIYPTPDGEKLSFKTSSDLSKEKNIIFLCGHYKGIDQRIRDEIVTDEISIGDYILSGGELPACVILDSIIRLIPGVLNSIESAETDSFFDGLLDCPYYTRPESFNNKSIPKTLKSGNHKKINEWRLNKRIEKTKSRRPDLYKKFLKTKN